MTVRHATYEDMPAVMEMTRKLYSGSDYVNEIMKSRLMTSRRIN